MKLFKHLKTALVAVAALVSTAATAQEVKPETFNFAKMESQQNNPWIIDQKLDGVSISRRRSGLTLTLATGDGKKAPEYSICSNSKDDDINAVRLSVGNTLSIKADKNTITKVQLFYTTRSKAAYGKNYEMTEGDYPGDKQYTYIWNGSTQNFNLKNIGNKGGIEIHKVVVTYSQAE